MNMLWALAILVGTIAVVQDLSARSVSNWVTAGGFSLALLCRAATGGVAGFALAIAGFLVGLGILIVFYWRGAMGGGDVKLMAAFGAMLGPTGTLTAALLAAIIGGFLAVAALLRNRRQRAIPYAPAIVLGAWLALLGNG